MRVRIQTADPRPIYVQIMDEVRRALVLGALASDDPLPSVRELAADLKVNPNTVSQAYRELERTGVVYTRRGRGTYVASDSDADGTERRSLARAVAQRAMVDAHRNGLSMDELVEALRSIAGGASPDNGPASASPSEKISAGEER